MTNRTTHRPKGRLLTTTEAARLSHLSAKTVRRCIDQGLLRGGRKAWFMPINGRRAGGTHRYVLPEDLLDFLRRHRIPICRELREMCQTTEGAREHRAVPLS